MVFKWERKRVIVSPQEETGTEDIVITINTCTIEIGLSVGYKKKESGNIGSLWQKHWSGGKTRKIRDKKFLSLVGKKRFFEQNQGLWKIFKKWCFARGKSKAEGNVEIVLAHSKMWRKAEKSDRNDEDRSWN